MNVKQIDPKYRITVEPEYPRDEQLDAARISIVNLAGVPIPDDEPLILFRARDYLALPTLRHYYKLAVVDSCTDFHLDGIEDRITVFTYFAKNHPERMKQPGSTEGL